MREIEEKKSNATNNIQRCGKKAIIRQGKPRMIVKLQERGVVSMLIYHGGKQVKAGTYWNPASGESVAIPREGGILPGGREVWYLRMPLVAMIGPLIGLLFYIFLPLTGIVVVTLLAIYRLGQALRLVGCTAAQTVMPGWKPGEAHLLKQGKRKKEGSEDKLAHLEKEIEKKQDKR